MKTLTKKTSFCTKNELDTSSAIMIMVAKKRPAESCSVKTGLDFPEFHEFDRSAHTCTEAEL